MITVNDVCICIPEMSASPSIGFTAVGDTVR